MLAKEDWKETPEIQEGYMGHWENEQSPAVTPLGCDTVTDWGEIFPGYLWQTSSQGITPANAGWCPLGSSDNPQEDHEAERNGLEQQQEAEWTGGGGQGAGPEPSAESQQASHGAGGGT